MQIVRELFHMTGPVTEKALLPNIILLCGIE